MSRKLPEALTAPMRYRTLSLLHRSRQKGRCGRWCSGSLVGQRRSGDAPKSTPSPSRIASRAGRELSGCGDASRTPSRRRSALIDLTADGTITHEDLRDKLAELAESPARDLPYLLDKRRVVRDHETLPDERTPDNPGIYTLTPDRNRHLPEEEIARKEHEAEDERSERYRAMYNELGLRVVGHPDGTLEASWRLGRPCCVEAVTRVPIATLQSTSTRPYIP
jgi:hypothetical protein